MRLLVYIALLSTSQVFAVTGNQALELFPHSDPGRNLLVPYAMGLMDAEVAVKINARYAKSAGERSVKPYCQPRGASYMQGAQIIENELRRYPERNHEALFLIARRALLNAWPCDEE